MTLPIACKQEKSVGLITNCPRDVPPNHQIHVAIVVQLPQGNALTATFKDVESVRSSRPLPLTIAEIDNGGEGGLRPRDIPNEGDVEVSIVIDVSDRHTPTSTRDSKSVRGAA